MSVTKSDIGMSPPGTSPETGKWPEFELGVTRFFGRGDLNSRYFDRGWAIPEENHSWNDGIDTSLILPLKSCPTKTCALKIKGIPYLTDNIRHQDMTLYVNGHRTGFWRLDARQTYFLIAEIVPEFWFDRGGKGFAKCVWHIPGSARPSEIPGINDKRQLGFCFQEITLEILSS